jgi:hypothetical protein
MDSGLLNDLYEFIPEKFFLRGRKLNFGVYRMKTRQIRKYNVLRYVTDEAISITGIPHNIRVREYSILGNLGVPKYDFTVTLEWICDSEITRGGGSEPTDSTRIIDSIKISKDEKYKEWLVPEKSRGNKSPIQYLWELNH